MSFIQIGYGLTHKHWTKLERPGRDKHSSLFRNSVNYSRKKLYKIGPCNCRYLLDKLGVFKSDRDIRLLGMISFVKWWLNTSRMHLWFDSHLCIERLLLTFFPSPVKTFLNQNLTHYELGNCDICVKQKILVINEMKWDKFC